MIGLVYAAQGQRPPDGVALAVDVKVFDYSLAEIPTHHIEECFARAFRNKRDDYALRASAVNVEWDNLKVELRAQASQHGADVEYQLMSGEGSLGAMIIEEWKTRHNLPATWRLGQAFPPESDLYGKPVPLRKQERALCRCLTCKDARWVREAADISREQSPRLRPCPDCGGK